MDLIGRHDSLYWASSMADANQAGNSVYQALLYSPLNSSSSSSLLKSVCANKTRFALPYLEEGEKNRRLPRYDNHSPWSPTSPLQQALLFPYIYYGKEITPAASQSWCPSPFLSPAFQRRPVVILTNNTDKDKTTTKAAEDTFSGDEDDTEIIEVGTEHQDHTANIAAAAVGSSSMAKRKKRSSATIDSPSSPHLDVAACDGPVTFHRVLNDCADGVHHINPSDEDDRKNEKDPSTSSTNQSYRCLFCNHVFKSRYCYQKHKRRHLNPFLLAGEEGNNGMVNSAHHIKDINVQFFPCKICGAKFPSYYFVHKHKKLWHEEGTCTETENNASSTEDVNDSSGTKRRAENSQLEQEQSRFLQPGLVSKCARQI